MLGSDDNISQHTNKCPEQAGEAKNSQDPSTADFVITESIEEGWKKDKCEDEGYERNPGG